MCVFKKGYLFYSFLKNYVHYKRLLNGKWENIFFLQFLVLQFKACVSLCPAAFSHSLEQQCAKFILFFNIFHKVIFPDIGIISEFNTV